MRLWNFREEQAKIGEVISTAALKDDVASALDHYYDTCGYLPFADGFSIGRIFDGSERQPISADELWSTVWSWADKKSTPLSRYHACQIFVTHPRLVPEDKLGMLWEEILNVTHLQSYADKSRRWTEAWRLRCDLARHFCHYFEARAPGQSGERIATLAWWISERIAGIFGTDAEVIRQVHQSTVELEYGFSSNVWQLVVPPVFSDALRYGTLMVNSIWALSLQAQIDPSLVDKTSPALGDERRAAFEQSLMGTLVTLFPLQQMQPVIYAFEKGIHSTVEAYASGQSTEMTAGLRGLVALSRELGKPERFDEMLGDLATAGESEAIMFGQAIRVSAYLGKVPLELLWNRLCDAKWREQVLANASHRTLALICDALVQIEAIADAKWATHLPHFFAMACEQTSADKEKQEGLFFCVLATSVCGGKVSAIHRLLRGPKRTEFVPFVAAFIEKLDHLQPALSPWAAGRVRALRAALSAA